MTDLPPQLCRAATFEDEEDARDLAQGMREQGFDTCSAYVCPSCGGWHVGTPPKPRIVN